MSNFYKSGSFNVICQRCGFQYKSEEVKKEWDGIYVCDPCYEVRHPQEFIRAVKDGKPLPFTAPEPADAFTTVSYVASTVGSQSNDVPAGTNKGDL